MPGAGAHPATLPLRPGIPERQNPRLRPHGVTCLFAALNAATGQVTDACYPRHRHQEFLKFLKKIAAAYPGVALHVVLDNYATHKHQDIRTWLARAENQRITLHFTPTSCSWLNLVECFCSIITRQAIRRGSFTSVRQLTAAIGAFTDGWNDHPGRSPGPRTPTRSSPASRAPRLKQTPLQTTSALVLVTDLPDS